MGSRIPVYNGYEERYLTGAELKTLFHDSYYTSGRHHSVVLGLSIPDYLDIHGIDNHKTYRIFVNSFFCRIADGETDQKIIFFGHVKKERINRSNSNQPIKADIICPQCGAKMRIKKGKYGEFLGCTKYPTCKYSQGIPILGNTI